MVFLVFLVCLGFLDPESALKPAFSPIFPRDRCIAPIFALFLTFLELFRAFFFGPWHGIFAGSRFFKLLDFRGRLEAGLGFFGPGWEEAGSAGRFGFWAVLATGGRGCLDVDFLGLGRVGYRFWSRLGVWRLIFTNSTKSSISSWWLELGFCRISAISGYSPISSESPLSAGWLIFLPSLTDLLFFAFFLPFFPGLRLFFLDSKTDVRRFEAYSTSGSLTCPDSCTIGSLFWDITLI